MNRVCIIWLCGLSIAVNAADPDLVLELNFNDPAWVANGVVIDASGNVNHMYKAPGSTTNWPALVQNPTNLTWAAEFRNKWDGYGIYGRAGDYGVVWATNSLLELTNMTVMVRARYYAITNWSTGETGTGQAPYANLISGVWYDQGGPGDGHGTWQISRGTGTSTDTGIYTSNDESVSLVYQFPDHTSSLGESTNWNHYAFTLSNSVVTPYFNGAAGTPAAWSTNYATIFTTGIDADVHDPAELQDIGWLAIGCNTHGMTPYWYWSTDNVYPNNGFLEGAMDDIRIYKRALSADEVLSIARAGPVSSSGTSIATLNVGQIRGP